MGKLIPALDEWRAAEQLARSAEHEWSQALDARDRSNLERLRARGTMSARPRPLFFRVMREAASAADEHHCRNIASGGRSSPDPATPLPSTGEAPGYAGGAPLAGSTHDNPPGEAAWNA